MTSEKAMRGWAMPGLSEHFRYNTQTCTWKREPEEEANLLPRATTHNAHNLLGSMFSAAHCMQRCRRPKRSRAKDRTNPLLGPLLVCT